ncbi:putative RNA recognition motif domain, nucleotide-binding alpha-beta plait domain superfamily [Helianthus annuus]|nr:putative RNA recognition motif domain, nucleotide-binding alpha-beta plait domain superfamily [Helianthus annuus]
MLFGCSMIYFVSANCLSKRTTDEGLRECFAKFGEVLHGWSKGFGFVRYSTLEEAAAGIEGMDGKFLDGWVIFAEYARPRDSPPPSPPSYGNNQYGRQ